ncbi:hypothetical protein [Scytonema sp. NUACC21]
MNYLHQPVGRIWGFLRFKLILRSQIIFRKPGICQKPGFLVVRLSKWTEIRDRRGERLRALTTMLHVSSVVGNAYPTKINWWAMPTLQRLTMKKTQLLTKPGCVAVN